jgi:putative transposase
MQLGAALVQASYLNPNVYRRRPGFYGGAVHNVATNILDRQFDVAAPNTARVTDITYVRTYEGRLYLAVVVDLITRQVVG